MTRNDDIEKFFNPKSIAILGASRSPAKFGNVFLRAYQLSGFEGEIYPINPKANEINDLKAYPNIKSIPNKVDLAIISTHPKEVISLVKEIVEKGVSSIIIFSAGFGELGDLGKKREKKLLEIIKGKASIIGPNCIGIYVPSTKLSFFPGIPLLDGNVAFVSQSGFICATISRWGAIRGIGFSKVISLGNSVDLTITDFLEYFESDPKTKIISIYIEGVKDGPRFLKLIKRISRKKPIIIWKTGNTELGHKVVSSHTGSIAGSIEIWDSIIKQNHLISVNSIEEILDYYQTFLNLNQYRNIGQKICLIASQGGLISNATDMLVEHGIELGKLSSSTIEQLKQIIPDFGTNVDPSMPIDISIAAALDMNLYIRVAQVALPDPNIDIVIILGAMEITNEFGKALIKLKEKFRKPIILVQPVIPDRLSKIELKLRKNGILIFYTFKNAIKCIRHLFDFIDYTKRELD
ncbi:MAG: acetate--CoA ligase family protein [Candidatus Helarchaeota archaeon]